MSFKSIQEEKEFKIKVTGKDLEPVECTFWVWSSIGHTPITKRSGAYCDELLKVTKTVYSRSEAQNICDDLLKNTEHGASAYFDLGESYWNHNLRTGHGKH